MWLRSWRLWTAPAAVVRYVLAVDVVAVALAAGSAVAFPVASSDLVWFAVLALGGIAHLEVARGIERLRETATEGVPYTNLKSTWIFAGVLLLPPALVAALIVIAYVHSWYRVYGSSVLYRKIYSAATMVLASGAAAAVLAAIDPGAFPGLPRGATGLLATVAAAFTWWFVNYALVVVAIVLADPRHGVRPAMGSTTEQLVIAASLGFGAAIATMLATEPWMAPTLLVTVLAVHRGLMLYQFERVARTDQKTGLLNATFWHEITGKEFARARRLGRPLGLLMIDLDHFKAVNDRYGHQAGDRVLREVAGLLRAATRRHDLVGRFGGEEFVVTLPNVSATELAQLAEQICKRIRGLSVDLIGLDGPTTVSQLTASVGAARYPDIGAEQLDELLLAADNALFAAKDAGRDQVRTVRTAPLR